MHSSLSPLREMPMGSGSYFLAEEQIETQKAENKILRQKLQSKSEALVILTKELDKLRSECDDYRELTKRLQTRGGNAYTGVESFSYNSRTFRDHVIANHFSDLRDENKRLLAERENLRRVLTDREEDVRLLRSQLQKEKQTKINFDENNCKDSRMEEKVSENLVKQLEKLQIRCASLKQDLQSLLDEKEDLVQERDAYKCKVHRLNHSMSALLKSNSYKLVDIDCLLSENRYLRDSLEQVREEKKLSNEMGIRYKNALERSKPTKDPSAANSQGITNSAVEEILVLVNRTSFPCPKNLDLFRTDSLQELCLSLLETLNDRMLQLKHQRKANKHILERLNQLENKILSKNKDIGELILRPSQHLMKDYSGANVDEELFDSSTNSTTPSTEEGGCCEETDPDLSESVSTNLQKLMSEIRRNSLVADSTLNPPDIIANEFHRPVFPGSLDDAAEKEKDSDLLNDPIVLPDHLQRLVDEAMKDILCQNNDIF